MRMRIDLFVRQTPLSRAQSKKANSVYFIFNITLKLLIKLLNVCSTDIGKSYFLWYIFVCLIVLKTLTKKVQEKSKF